MAKQFPKPIRKIELLGHWLTLYQYQDKYYVQSLELLPILGFKNTKNSYVLAMKCSDTEKVKMKKTATSTRPSWFFTIKGAIDAIRRSDKPNKIMLSHELTTLSAQTKETGKPETPISIDDSAPSSLDKKERLMLREMMTLTVKYERSIIQTFYSYTGKNIEDDNEYVHVLDSTKKILELYCNIFANSLCVDLSVIA